MQKTRFSRHVVAVLFILSAAGTLADDAIEEIVVTADFRGREAAELPASISVFDAEFLRGASVQHFEELINIVPNLNWSGDGHRARYFQIRGVGELEQYEGAPNPSVGFLLDDIDFSGIGAIATLYDVESVEVLRGPQGSRYGANALGGLIYVRSRAPGAERDGRLTLTVGGDDTVAVGAAFGGALDARETLLLRVSAQQHESNGFRDNAFLGRDDTNGRDETSIRAGLTYSPSDRLEARLSLVYSEMDNGYDAFALDNGYTMLSDQPGRDAQESLGASVRWDVSMGGDAMLTSITSAADSDMRFGFDADWGNEDSWAPFTYDYTSDTDRSRRTLSQEFRYVRDQWLLGVYAMELSEGLLTRNLGTYFDPFFDFADSLDDTFGSDYEARNLAAFGQFDHAFGNAWTLSAGLRVERRTTDYSDSAGLESNPSESMWGGELSLRREHDGGSTSYITLSRGYKAGGFNLGPVPQDRRNFGAESLVTLEAGLKVPLAEESLRLDLALFTSRREDQQVRVSEQLVPGDPASFVFFTANAPGSSASYGVEANLEWRVAEAWEIYANLGLLHTELGDSGRAQAHAPEYTLAAGAVYRSPGGFFARLDLTARDAFYFDVSHDQRSNRSELASARIGYEGENWALHLWARNLFDQRYAVRGFYFGNEPPDFPDTLYVRLGDPRQLGVTIERRFH